MMKLHDLTCALLLVAELASEEQAEAETLKELLLFNFKMSPDVTTAVSDSKVSCQTITYGASGGTGHMWMWPDLKCPLNSTKRYGPTSADLS